MQSYTYISFCPTFCQIILSNFTSTNEHACMHTQAPIQGGQGLGPPPPSHKILLPQIVRRGSRGGQEGLPPRGPRGPWPPPPLQNPGSAYDTYIHTYIYIHTTCIHTYMYTCIHVYIHTYTHKYRDTIIIMNVLCVYVCVCGVRVCVCVGGGGV